MVYQFLPFPLISVQRAEPKTKRGYEKIGLAILR